MTKRPSETVIGFRVKTGRAIAVALRGEPSTPQILWRREVRLWDPKVPGSGQPYHQALERPGARGEAAMKRGIEVAHAVAERAFHELRDELAAGDAPLGRIGLVVSSLVDPASIASPHMRAHASEGRLFREVLELAARGARVPCATHLQRELAPEAARSLGREPDEVARQLKSFGETVGRPWRADEKEAALAAWIALRRAGVIAAAVSLASRSRAARPAARCSDPATSSRSGTRRRRTLRSGRPSRPRTRH